MATTRSDQLAALDRQLEAAVRNAGGRTVTVVIDGDPVELSPAALKTVHKALHALAAGDEPMLTTTEAAETLGVSRPYLTRLLKAGRLPYRKKGNRHLVPLSAIDTFKQQRDRRLDEMTRLAEAEEQLGVR